MSLNDHHPSETSPLIERQNQESNGELPCISDAEHDLYPGGLPLLTSPKAIEDVVQEYSLPSQSLIDALTLILCIRRISGAFLELNSSILPWSFVPAPEVEEFVLTLWNRLSTESSDDELGNILWPTFALTKHTVSSSERISVIQTLLFESPPIIALDNRISKVLADAWRRGLPHERSETSAPLRPGSYATIVAPRVLHLVDLSISVVYIGIASNYALDPAGYSNIRHADNVDPRSVLLLIYSVSRLLTAQWKQNIHFALTALSLMASKNLSPRMDDSTYILFLLSLSLNIVQLQLPVLPSPIFLIPSFRTLPISCILYTIISQIFIPALLFFLPVLLLVSVLLSLSLSDVFLLLQPQSFVGPAPENARFAFVMLGSLILALFSCLITCMVLASPTISQPRRAVLTWDAYGTKVGLAARRTFFGAVHHYSRPYPFPAPLNILEILFVAIPCNTLRALKREKSANHLEYTLKRVLWTSLVFPLATCAASVWLWGLLP
ncbi:hypothetical protein SCHPADRAFT_940089 [Schizopora paradoxa]|uniref:Uncharacterized protein n=1 Tax=Schizopora paradoxa TaxID=27342 RepID=A0A0H2SA62_9AGAM|nr:hypothetical protein SCHPADRAFT_940089 [Schizopora paradoxa]